MGTSPLFISVIHLDICHKVEQRKCENVGEIRIYKHKCGILYVHIVGLCLISCLLGLQLLKSKCCGMSAETGIVQSKKMPVLRQCLSKLHTAATLTHATVFELTEAVFSMQSAATATSHYNEATAGRSVFCGVCSEAI
jgi:hypothetical protein